MHNNTITGHMLYKLLNEPPCVFTGDHIFICGNGKEEQTRRVCQCVK